MTHATRPDHRADHRARNREDRRMLERYHHSRDPACRDALVERFLPLARNVARRYSRDSESFDDLAQVAAIGLIKALDRYDPARGVAFSTYAVPTISGELKRHFRDRTWAVRPPRELLERTLRVGNAIERLSTEHGRAPTVADLVAHLGDLDEEAVLDALEARRASTARSLSAPSGTEEDDAQTLGDRLGGEDDGYDLADDRVVLDGLTRALQPRQRAILHMRFVQDMTQAEIGAEIGVSQMQVSRLVRQALQRMRAVAGMDEQPADRGFPRVGAG